MYTQIASTTFLQIPENNLGLRLLVISVISGFILMKIFGFLHNKKTQEKPLSWLFKIAFALLIISALCAITGFIISCFDITLIAVVLSFFSFLLHLVASIDEPLRTHHNTDPFYDYQDPL